MYISSVHSGVLAMSSSVNVTQLRQNLPDYLKQVQEGKEIEVTVRGKVIDRKSVV